MSKLKGASGEWRVVSGEWRVEGQTLDTSFSPKVKVFCMIQDCGATLRVAIHDAERRVTLRRPHSFTTLPEPLRAD